MMSKSASILLTILLAGCLAPATPAPAETSPLPWWNDRVFYEVFVRSFYDSDGNGAGDLRGLTARLNYLNDGNPNTSSDLGVTGLWLMPITESPSYHGYDVSDYKTVERDYGSNEDFKLLIAEAHRRGIRVIVDLVMNHTSSQHPWFVDARTPGSARDDWYIWAAQNPGYPGPWGQPVWHRAGNRYYYAIFWDGMPDLNLRNPQVTEALNDVIRFWLGDMGADGFRLDGVKHLIEDGTTQENTPATHDWLRGFASVVRSAKPDAVTVAEAWSATDEVVRYIGNQVDLAFEFDLAAAIVSSVQRGNKSALTQAQGKILAAYPRGQYAAFLSNHDQNRVITQLLDDVPSAKTAATLLLTNPGVPFIYYGEEIGMTGYKPDERLRTPMQWDATPDKAGFTTGAPWQALAESYEQRNVAAQDQDGGSLLSHYRQLIRLRQAHPALRWGEMTPVESDTAAVYSFLRHTPLEALLVVVNLSPRQVTRYSLSLPRGPLGGKPKAAMLFGQGTPAAPALDAAGGFENYTPLPALEPRSSAIIRLGP